MSRTIFTILLVIFASFYSVTAAYAQQEPPPTVTDDDVNDVAKKLYCPVCPNTPLDVCETKACQDWRAQIKSQLTDGWTEEEIIAHFVEQYGERVLAEPERQGFTSLVWVLPVIVLGLGLVLIWQVLGNWKANQNKATLPSNSDLTIAPEILEKIEREIRELD